MRKYFIQPKYFLIIVIFISISVALGIRIVSPKWKSISSDGFGYYVYLPQILKYQDIKGVAVLNNLAENEQQNAQGRLLPLENGNYINKYPIGEALLMLPFFLGADLINSIFIHGNNYFEGIFSLVPSIASIFYFSLGIIFLQKILGKFLSNKVTLITLTLVIFGTNLLHYSTFDPSFSHVYSFALFSIFTYFVIEFENYKNKLSYWATLGGLIGLIISVRQTNVIISILLLYPLIKEIQNLGLKQFLKSYAKSFVTFAGFAILLFLPQIIYWYIVTGSPLVSSYSYNAYETFNILHPEVGNVLFSARKGLFFWTPILLLSIPGFILMFKKRVEHRYPFLSVLLIQLFIVSAWWAWSYGFSFGHRAFTEFAVFFALPLGFFVDWLIARKQRHYILIGFVIIGLLMFLNLFQMQQYWRGLLHPDGMTIESYIKIFMQPCIGKIEFLRCDWL